MSEQVLNVIGAIGTIFGIISPFIMTYIAYRLAKTERGTKKYREAQKIIAEQNRTIADQKKKAEDTALQNQFAAQKQELRDVTESQNNQIKDLVNTIDNLGKSVNTFIEKADKIDSIDSQLDKLIQMSDINFQYSRSLSSVVVTIGQSLKQQKLDQDSEIDASITTHKKVETDLLNKLCKVLM